MVMKICPKWKMDSAAELAVKNWYVQTKTESYPLTGVSISGGPLFRRQNAGKYLGGHLGGHFGDTAGIGQLLGIPIQRCRKWKLPQGDGKA